MIRFASLGSGSRGNALAVVAGETALLVDCGFPLRTTTERLARLGLAPDDLAGILVTHEHSDHLAGVFPLARKFGLPVYLTEGTWHSAEERLGSRAKEMRALCRLIRAGQSFSLGCADVLPFAVPHDAREPVQFALSCAGHALGVLTDTGWITPHIVDCVKRCDALVLEFNHDATRLASSSYPAMLKRRIASDFGHLENRQALGLLDCIESSAIQHVVAAHLSEENNCPELVRGLLETHPAVAGAQVGIASQSEGFDWRSID